MVNSNEKNSNTTARAIKVSLLIAVAFILLATMMNLRWESNDDRAISYVLSANGNYFSPFQGKLLSVLISTLYHKITVVEWWLVFSLFCIGVGTASIVYIIRRRFSNVLFWPLTGIALCTVFLCALSPLNFTRTATLVGFGGSLLLAQSVFETEGKALAIAEYVVGLICLLLGSMIRLESGLLALAFFALMVGYQFLFKEKFSIKFEWWREHGKQIIVTIFVAILFLASTAINNAFLTQDEKDYIEYNALRASIQDYAYSYPDWEQAGEEYTEMGLFEGDQDLFMWDWFSEDTNVFSVEVLQKFKSLYQKQFNSSIVATTLEDIVNSSVTYIFIAVLLLFFFWNRKKNLPICLMSGAMAVLFTACFIYLGRLPMRVYETTLYMLIGVVFFLAETKPSQEEKQLACVLHEKVLHSNAEDEKVVIRRLVGFVGTNDRVQPKIQDSKMSFYPTKYLLPIVLSVIMVVSVFQPQFQELENSSSDRKDLAYKREITDYYNSDKDKVYLFTTYEAPAEFYSGFDIWEPLPGDYWDNVFNLGGWGARMPIMQERLKKYGIDNPVEGLIEMTNVYSGYYPSVLEFLQNHYDENITASRVDDVFDFTLVQYTKPIADVEIANMGILEVTMENFSYRQADGADAWLMQGSFSHISQEYEAIYCNVTVDGTRYTYRLALNENDFIAYFYGIPQEFEASNGDIIIFAKNQQGEYVLLAENIF